MSNVINYPKFFAIGTLLFSTLTMVAGIVNAKSIQDDSEYKKTHKNEYNLAVYTAVICAISIILFLFIIISSILKGQNYAIMLGVN
jgi:uncharacterized membrane protein YidH (DUF202 family)